MPTVVDLLKPTRIKLVFLVEWTLFILITLAKGELRTNQVLVVAAYPLILLYLVACVLNALSQHTQRVAQGWGLLGCAVGLIMLDQTIKTGVTASIPYQTRIPIIDNWLVLTHERNLLGSWVASAFKVQPVGLLSLIQWGLTVPVLLFSVLCRRYYVATHRRTLWVDVAFLGIFAGYASWVCDMSLRGHIVDFIHLPGLVTADLKDIFTTIGVAALVAEALDNPQLSWRWQGIKKEIEDSRRLIKSLYHFTLQELDGLRRAVTAKFGRTAKPE
jgi:lipoprotein signal peptidase